MSGRGGKRRQVLQLGNASKLHHYGYSKGFHTSDKKGKGGLPVLVGNYSNSDSEDSEETEENIATDVNEEEEILASDTPDASLKTEQPADMDDELKNFLSEIEAIPAVPETDSTEQPPVPMEDVKPEPEKAVEADVEVKSPAEAVQDTQKPVPKTKPSSYHYSMFVRGESEFVHSPKPDTEDVKSPAVAKEEDIPDEPTTNWQMVKDENTHYYYYWNIVTNEVTWEIPTEYTQYLLLHREYEEKVAKYSPEQLQKLKEKHSMAAGDDSGDAVTGLAHPKHADTSTDFSKGVDGRLSTVTAERPDGSVRDSTRSRSVSPRPEAGQDSRPHKHKKEKRSHHKKKHKRRHSDSQSDEDKPSPKVPQTKKPPVLTETSTVTLLAGSRLTSIVPYLSDQDDSDEDNNMDPVPLLGSVAVSLTDSQDKEHGGTPSSEKSIREDPPQLELSSTASQDLENVAAEVSLQLGPTQASAEAASSSLIFSPPPPPPPPKEEAAIVKDLTEEEDSDLKKNTAQTLDEPQTDSATDLPKHQSDTDSDRQMIDSESSAVASQFAEVEINEIMRAIVDPQVEINEIMKAKVDPEVEINEIMKAIVDPEVEINEIMRAIVDPQIEINQIMRPIVDPVLATRAADETQAPAVRKSDSTVDVAQPVKEPAKIRHKEVIDMFAEDFPMPVSVQVKDVASVDKGSVVIDDQVRKGPETSAEVMEDGEMFEMLEKKAQMLRKGQEASRENGSDKKSRTQEKNLEKKSKTQENSFEKESKVGISLEKEKTSGNRVDKRSKTQESSVEKGHGVQEDSLEKKSQPPDNSLEESKSKTHQNVAENNSVKTLDKSGSRIQENSSEKIRNKTHKNSSEKVRSKIQENSSEKTRSKTYENSSGKVRDKTQENSSETSRSKTQVNSSEKSRSKTQVNSSEKVRDKTQEDSSEKIRSKTQENSSEKIRNKTRENRSERSRRKQDSKSENIRSKPQESRSEKSKKKIRENSSENRSSLVEQTALKSVNIVGYASDEEEEEGEVRETVVSKADKPTHLKQRDHKKESKKHRADSKKPLSSSTDTHRIDSKTPLSSSSDIYKTDSKVPLPSSSDKKLGSELVSRIPVSLTEVTSEATLDQVAEKPEKVCDDADDDDIDFDVDDIDRALELALEKKLEKKKIQLQSMTDNSEIKVKGETLSTGTSGELIPGHILSSSPSTQIKGPDNGGSETSGVADPVKKVAHGAKTEDISPQREDEKLVADIRNMAELALSKLEFLDISTDNLSRLQVLFIELQTRFTDWTAAGLSTQYFHEQLKTAERLLEQYELSAVPEGWACQWDRSNNRYYYRNKVTNSIQWEYPEVDGKGDVEAAEPIAENSDESTSRVRDRGVDDHHRSRSSGSSRHRRREDKDKSKYEKHSSSRHSHRKRRRGRDHSNSSYSSSESQQYRRHRKSKKKKRHRAERSPSVEIVEHLDDNLDGVEIIEAPVESTTVVTPLSAIPSPSMAAPPASPSASLVDASTTGHLNNAVDTEGGPATAPEAFDADLDGFPLQSGEEDMACDQDVPEAAHVDSSAQEEVVEVANPAVISKPPQIIINPRLVTALNPDTHLTAELYSTTQIVAPSQASFYQSYPIAPPLEHAPPTAEMATESSEASLEAAKKKKKDKKSLATGSSIMMKKKHMSSMVQKWQKVKVEVEKEDRAKELRQAAIRRKIEELKNVDKQEKQS